MLVHNERIVHEYLMWAMCGNPHPALSHPLIL
jgi:aspartate 4-decarboxylase